MRIVITSITDNGVHRCNKEFIQELLEQKHEVIVIAPNKDKNRLIEKMGCKYINVSIEPHGTNPIKEMKMIKQYIKLYKTIKPDLVIAYTIKPNIYSGIACRKLKIDYISSINGIGDSLFNKSIVQKIVIKLLRIALKNAKKVFFQNKYNVDFFVKNKIVNYELSEVVPGSGINLTEHTFEEYPNPNDSINIIYIGRVTRDKGARELIDGINEICKSYQTRFIIVGKCDELYKDDLDNLVNKKYVTYLGMVQPDEIHELIKKSYAVILPSYHEGISNALLEGGACGRPLLTTYAEGCIETFEDNVTGIGFNPKSTESLIAAVNKFLNLDYESKKMMGKLSRKKIEQEFDRRIVVDAFIREVKRIEKGK